MTLPTRRHGQTELEITRVGFGAWAIGGAGWAAGWGPQDDEDSVRAIRHAAARGVDWVDTAAAYGLGHSEEVVGRALRETPDGERPYVFTKCGVVRREDPMQPGRRYLGPESIRRECDVAWTAAWPGVTAAIVGARSPAQVDGWRAAAELELTDDDLDELARRWLRPARAPARGGPHATWTVS